jgi:Transglycosylase-like domain
LRQIGVCLLALAALLVLQENVPARESAEKLEAIRGHRAAAWRWQGPKGRYLDWLEELWQRRAQAARRRAARPPHLKAWLCIHRYERHPGQGWATRTGNGYYGGLQMDLSFQRRHGGDLLRRKGTADRWTRLEQMWVAERAYRAGHGFYPWANTARACGLL